METYFNSEDILIYTLNFFDKSDLYYLDSILNNKSSISCHNNNINLSVLKLSIKQIILHKKIINLYFNKICLYSTFLKKYHLFEDLDFIYKIPELKFKPSFLGSTGYIDGINYLDLSYPIMRGIDNWDREFIVLKYKISEHNRIYTQTIFQRYSDSFDSWNKAGSNQGPILDDTRTGLTKPDLNLFVTRIKNIVKNGEFVLKKYTSITNDDDDYTEHIVKGCLVY